MKSAKPAPTRRRKRETRFEYQVLEPKQMLSANLPSMDLQVELTRDYLGNHADTRYLVEGDNDVQLIEFRHGLASSTALYQQISNGIPVYGSYLTVEQDTRGGFIDVNHQAVGHFVATGSNVPEFEVEAAQKIVSDSFAEPSFIQSSELVWHSSGSLAWQIDTILGDPWAAGTADYSTVVDARTGNIISQQQPTSVSQLLYNPETQTGVFPRIVINDAIGSAGSRDYALAFGSVVALPGCTGTLVAPDVVISARHCGSSVGDSIRFGEDSSNPIFTATVESVSLPAGAGSLLDGGDFSILTLTADVPSTIATPMRLIDLTDGLEGLVAATVGYGLNGIGSEGHQNSSDGFRWGGENVIDVYGVPASQTGTNIISTDFDDGTAANNTIPAGDITPLEFEATTAPGDSGGPIMVQVGTEWVVAGVLSGGTTSTSVYGDISWWTGVQPYRAQIESVGGVFVEGTVAFDKDSYLIGETITVSVEDNLAASPVQVTVTSDSGDSELLSLAGVSPNFSGTIDISAGAVIPGDGILQVAVNDTITVNYGVNAIDQALIDVESIAGTSGDDIIHVVIDDITIVTVNGVDNFIDTASKPALTFDAKSGYDRITIVDSSGNDAVEIRDKSVTVDGFFFFVGNSVESVEVTSGGGNDTARLIGSSRDELFESFGNQSKMTGDGFTYGVFDYDDVSAFGISGNDRAAFVDSPGDDRFYGALNVASLTTPSQFVYARDFDKVSTHSVNGGNDIASMVGTDGNDSLFANQDFAFLKGNGIELTAAGFDRTWTHGGAGQDTATLIGTGGDDSFNSRPLNAYLFSKNYFNQAVFFENVNADAGTDGNDRAILRDSPGADVFYGTPTSAVLYSDQYRSRATRFDTVSAFGSAGYDIATLVDSAGDDRYIARPTDAYLVGDTFLTYVREFDRVDARSTAGSDISILRGSTLDNRVFASRSQTYVTGLNFFNSAENFRRVTIQLGSSGFNVGVFQDSNQDDGFVGAGANATLFSDDYLVFVENLDRVTAISSKGGADTLSLQDIDYQFASIGDWIAV